MSRAFIARVACPIAILGVLLSDPMMSYFYNDVILLIDIHYCNLIIIPDVIRTQYSDMHTL